MWGWSRPEAELTFIAKGFEINRKAVMHNDFVLIGPTSDPGNINQSSSAIKMMKNKPMLSVTGEPTLPI